jgi:PIN domain nuclease of toxin-antitoxin system
VNEHVLDSSVLLAIIKGERLNRSVYDLVEGAVMSAANLAEVYSRVSDLGLALSPNTDALVALLGRIEPLTEGQARATGSLRAQTRHAGLSLGDRACLALALELGAEVYTADRAWAGINLGCPIHLVR